MLTGTPAVTTTVGAEAMHADLPWNGTITDDQELFTDSAAALYQHKELWLQARQNGIRILNERYGKTQFTVPFMEAVEALFLNLTTHRQHNFFGQILHYHTANSSKYMSLWIEEKNANKLASNL